MSSPYRETSRISLRPAYTSLGLQPSDFTPVPGSDRKASPFDAGVNCGPAFPDCAWLFRGGDCFRYDLRANALVEGPVPLAQWGGPTWPALFATGIDAAAWGGPAYPNLHYFFKGDLVARRNAATGGVDVQPVNIVAHGFASVAGTELAKGIGVAFHDVRAGFAARLHLVRGGTYVQHDLNTGQRAAGPMPLSDFLKVPGPFGQGPDIAFFGAGENAETLYLLKDLDCCAYDLGRDRVLHAAPIDAVFRGMRPFLPKPQLFLVEDFTLSTYCGEPMRGGVVDSVTVGPRSKETVTLVIERETSSARESTRSILESAEDEVVNDLHKNVSNEMKDDASSESYRYHMDAKAHGEAKAVGLWGGSVDLSANVSGGSDDTRRRLASSVLDAVKSQVKSTEKRVSRRTQSSEETSTHKERVVSTKESVVDNSASDRMLVTDFFQMLQPYLVIVSLTRVRIACADGRGAAEIHEIGQLRQLLERVLHDEETRARVEGFVRSALGNVSDYEGKAVSILAEGDGGAMRVRPGFSSQYVFVREDGSSQSISLPGIAIAASRDLTRTGELFPQQRFA